MIVFTVFVFLLWQTFCTSLPSSAYYGRDEACDELVLLNVVHRHGDRTRDESTYPNDPYINETFFPFGPGQLTNRGKLRMYNAGAALKRRYGCFLGDLYYPDLLDTRSTDLNRTKASVLLLSAGLFPPRGPIVWSPLDWTPIPYNYEKSENDYLLASPFITCKKYTKLFSEHIDGEGAQLFSDDLEFYKYVSEYSGYNVTTPFYMYSMYFTVKPEEEWGLEVPEWIKPYLDTEFRNGAIKQYQLQTATTELKKLSGGFFVKKLLEDSLQKINNTLSPGGRKLFIYSGHEFDVANILGSLGIYHDIIPDYGSYIVIELRKINGVYGFKFLLQNYEDNGELQLLTLPDCDSFCPINEFVKIVQDIIPESESNCDI